MFVSWKLVVVLLLLQIYSNQRNGQMKCFHGYSRHLLKNLPDFVDGPDAWRSGSDWSGFHLIGGKVTVFWRQVLVGCEIIWTSVCVFLSVGVSVCVLLMCTHTWTADGGVSLSVNRRESVGMGSLFPQYVLSRASKAGGFQVQTAPVQRQLQVDVRGNIRVDGCSLQRPRSGLKKVM